MNQHFRICVVCLALSSVVVNADDWPRFRGPDGSGIAHNSDSLPNDWSPSANLAWKSPLPGPGASSPIIVGGKVFVVCYSGYGLPHEKEGGIENLMRHLVCLDLKTGETIWRKDVKASLPEDSYYGTGVSSHGYASHTPVSDGINVYCFFGKGGVYAFDMNGDELWHADAGKESDPPRWGSSSSPVIYKNTVIVTASAESQSIIGFDKATGKKLWQQEAAGLDGMWGTPTLVKVDENRTDLVMLVAKELWGLDPDNGKMRWSAKATSSAQAYTSVIMQGTRAFAFSGQGGGSLALDVGGSGDISDTNIVWTSRVNATYASPVRHQAKLYVISRGILSVVDATSGDRLKQIRLQNAKPTGGRFGALDYASPVVVGDRLFFLNASGQMYVFGLGDEVKQLSVNEVTAEKEFFWGSPAVSDGRMVLRSSKHLYCIADQGDTVKPIETTFTQGEKAPLLQLPKGYQAVGPDKESALRSLCQATADTGRFSGVVLVADKGKVIYKEAFGLANQEWDIPNAADTKFRLASVSKQFCSMIVMQLVQEGKVKLNDKITDFLPHYRKDTGDKITLHHLLSHQSGIKDLTAGFDYRGSISRLSFGKDEFITAHCSGDLANEPGTIYSYCNAGYIILGRIIEKVTRKTFEQNLHERIFEPLGMRNSGFDRNRYVIEKRASGYTYGPFGLENADFTEMDSSPGAAGALYSTVDDMFLWDRALYTDRLLDKRHRDLMFAPNGDVPEVKAAGGRSHSVYGYGWQIYSRTHPVTKRRTKVINHGGAIHGFRAIENRLVDDDAFVIVLCNQGDHLGSSEVWNTVVRLSQELIHIVTEQPYRIPSKARLTQEQRMYEIVKAEGVEAAIEWFREKGKEATWGGSNLALANHLIEEGRVDDGLRLMAFDVEATPEKVWLLRKASQACIDNGRPEQALRFLKKALELRPDDDGLKTMQAEAEQSILKDCLGQKPIDHFGLVEAFALHGQVQVTVVLDRGAIGVEKSRVPIAQGPVAFGAVERQADVPASDIELRVLAGHENHRRLRVGTMVADAGFWHGLELDH